MITQEKIDEWIREAEERSTSSSQIIRFIGNRLRDLTKWNDELRAENLALRTDKKVEEYENRISSLEYQIDLLKRQLSGEIELLDASIQNEKAQDNKEQVNIEKFYLLIYNPQGQVLKVGFSQDDFSRNNQLTSFKNGFSPADLPPRILTVYNRDELLFVFDSGRTISMPVSGIPEQGLDNLDWQDAYLQTPLGMEELAFIKPIGRMSLFDYCIQVSRKGCIKKIKETIFESYLGKSYIGTGIKSSPDKTCDLVLCNQNNRLILVSKEGNLQCIEIDPLPATIEEVIRLNVTDHIIVSFGIEDNLPVDTHLTFITNNGKVIQRQLDWVNIAGSFKNRGQSIISQNRRGSGISLVSAGLVNDVDWGIALHSDGSVIGYRVKDITGTGTLFTSDSGKSVAGFTFHTLR